MGPSSYLDEDEVSQGVNVPVVGEPEEHGEHAGEDHASAEEVPQVHPLRNEAAHEHPARVGEQVRVVQTPLQLLSLLDILAVDLSCWHFKKKYKNVENVGLFG